MKASFSGTLGRVYVVTLRGQRGFGTCLASAYLAAALRALA